MNRIWFTPYAYAKMIYMRDKKPNEVSCMGITPNSLDLIEDLYFPEQKVQSAYVDLDEKGFAKMCDELAQRGLQPEQFMRIWIHTHPKNMGATPSGRDRQCMEESFSTPDWAVMMIFSQNGESFAELRMNKPFIMTQKLDIFVRYAAAFPASAHEAWDKEYEDNIKDGTPNLSQHRDHMGYGYTTSEKTQIQLAVEAIMEAENWTKETKEKTGSLCRSHFVSSKLTFQQVCDIAKNVAKMQPGKEEQPWKPMYVHWNELAENYKADAAALYTRLAIYLAGHNKINFHASDFVREASKHASQKTIILGTVTNTVVSQETQSRQQQINNVLS